jgi:hypothetical protein
MVEPVDRRDCGGKNRAPQKSDQPTGDQEKDEQMGEEAQER